MDEAEALATLQEARRLNVDEYKVLRRRQAQEWIIRELVAGNPEVVQSLEE
jgi:hypothetical protein